MKDELRIEDVALAVMLKLIETGQNLSLSNHAIVDQAWDVASKWWDHMPKHPFSNETPNRQDEGIGTLELSIRVRRCLSSAGISTIRDLVSHPSYDLLEIRSFGKTALREVRTKIGRIGLRLAGDTGSETGYRRTS